MLGSSPDLPHRVQYPARKSLLGMGPARVLYPVLWGNALGTVPELRHVAQPRGASNQQQLDSLVEMENNKVSLQLPSVGR